VIALLLGTPLSIYACQNCVYQQLDLLLDLIYLLYSQSYTAMEYVVFARIKAFLLGRRQSVRIGYTVSTC